jgi:hypothetical protein
MSHSILRDCIQLGSFGMEWGSYATAGFAWRVT